MYNPQALQTGSPSAFLLQRVVLVVWQLVQHSPARLDEDLKASKQTCECTHGNAKLGSFLSYKNKIPVYNAFPENVKRET